ncbi:N-acetylglucosamine-6-phosphate deacetylase [Paenibacillus sp. UNCCL117]|uniref:N-acetylglucosamine-6-phosphate deacetylase n=1 Tax=unclassified Paenibacillus TaxID=185978 RepID=UPI00088A50FA|nr:MULTISPECIES: amidohydrolase family protein [unclassified Paenibacillus]SDC23024.1 N-acetylglucosamine-6-phosphate deacetylase [Paenibacillus sp. cl123]SFW19192.1 N-acetylglucosamine-6-phosphate deacetylase [Paenibacillus sp. UNCCL117]
MRERQSKDDTVRIKGIHYRTGERIAVEVSGGRITGIREISAAEGAAPSGAAQSDTSAGSKLPLVGPGLVDLQLNGYGGFDLNTLPLSEATVLELTRCLGQYGITSYYPTIITNSDEAITEALTVIARTCDLYPEQTAIIAGIHLEGPFISPEDGARGAHGKAYVKAPDWELFCAWQKAAGGRIRILTLSPEWEEADAFIRLCAQSGVTVSIGHTAATPEQIRSAVRAGATMSTHLGNGAHGTLPRHPNYIWEQLAADELWGCVIADGFHLPEAVLKAALRTKGDKLVLVSDAVYLAGMEPGDYQTHIGGKVTLQPSGRLCLTEQPNLLAGSALPLTRGIEHMVRTGLCQWPQAWELASIRPARSMNLPGQAGLEPGAPADLALFTIEDAGQLRIHKTYKQGRIIYESDI